MATDAKSGVLQGAASGASLGAVAGPWGALVGGVAGGIFGGIMGNKAHAAAEAAERERRRQQFNESEKVLARGRLAEGSSGVLVGQSSMATHLTKMAAEFRRNHDWAMKQFALGQSLNSQANQFNTMASIGSSLFKFAESQNWGKSGPEADPQIPAPEDNRGSGAPFA